MDVLWMSPADYDQASNKIFERHLHAECRNFLYNVPAMSHTSPLSSYDSADRLLSFQRGLLAASGLGMSQTVKVVQNLALPGVDFNRKYNLDATGNWVDDGWSGSANALTYGVDCSDDNTQSRTTNNLNQIASVDEGAPTYDNKGNMLNDGNFTFTYDAFNRLIEAAGNAPDGSSVDVTYKYDALGRKISRHSGSDTTYFNYDGQQVVEETSASALLRQYIWGQYIDELIQQREYQHPPNGQSHEDLYPLSDLLFRTTALARQHPCDTSSGSPGGGTTSGSSGPGNPYAEVYDMDVYGRTRIYSSAGADGKWFSDDDTRTFKPICKYIYTGREYDADTGMYYYRARFYHPDMGRFLTRDPIGYAGGMNLYGYTGGNPLMRTDPSGQYDVGGHFWTVYTVAIAAGQPPQTAYDLAYFSQYTDQDVHYDAVPAAFRLLRRGLKTHANDLDIQEVLHQLHGANDEAPERQKQQIPQNRRALAGLISSMMSEIKQHKPTQLWEVGLVIHAFGDAYAHTYKDQAGVQRAFEPPLGHGPQGHEPDIIAHDVDKYTEYVNKLYDVLGGNRNNPAQLAKLQKIIANAKTLPDDVKQEAKAMEAFAKGQPFSYKNSYIPGDHNTDPLQLQLSPQQVQGVINRIKSVERYITKYDPDQFQRGGK